MLSAMDQTPHMRTHYIKHEATHSRRKLSAEVISMLGHTWKQLLAEPTTPWNENFNFRDSPDFDEKP